MQDAVRNYKEQEKMRVEQIAMFEPRVLQATAEEVLLVRPARDDALLHDAVRPALLGDSVSYRPRRVQPTRRHPRRPIRLPADCLHHRQRSGQQHDRHPHHRQRDFPQRFQHGLLQ